MHVQSICIEDSDRPYGQPSQCKVMIFCRWQRKSQLSPSLKIPQEMLRLRRLKLLWPYQMQSSRGLTFKETQVGLVLSK